MEENVNFDNEVLAYLSVRKDELIQSHSNYQQEHPEIREVLNDFVSSVLLHKPVSHLMIKCIRMIFLYTQRNTSTHSTPHPSNTSRSLSLGRLVLAREH